MTAKAIRDQIIVKPFPSDEMSEFGLIVPECFRERSNKALLVSVGEGTKKHPKKLVKGSIVFHVKDAGSEIEENGEKFYIMKSWDVLAQIQQNN